MASSKTTSCPNFSWASDQLYGAIRDDCPDTVKELLDTKLLDVNRELHNHLGMTPLFAAGNLKRYSIMDILLEAGADIDQRCRHEWIPIETFEQEKVNETNHPKISILHLASFEHNLELVKFLVERGADINDKKHGDYTALHFAVSKYNIDQALPTVKYLVENGADVNAKDCYYQTPLFIICSEIHFWYSQHMKAKHPRLSATNAQAMFTYLKDKGADLSAKDCLGTTLLQRYAGCGECNAECDESFFWAALPHCEADQLGLYGRNLIPIMCNSECDNNAIERVLRFVDVNQPDAFGQTSLFYPPVLRRQSVVKMLLERGLNINHANRMGLTALAYCVDATMFEFLCNDKGVDTTSKSYSSSCKFREYYIDHPNESKEILLGIHSTNIPTLRVTLRHDHIEKLINQSRSGFFFDRSTERQESEQIRSYARKIVTAICKGMSKDPALAVGDIQLSGSVREMTKVHQPDEFDFVLELTHFGRFLKTPSVKDEEGSLTQLHCNADKKSLPAYIIKYFDTNGVLNFRKLLVRFNGIIAKILSQESFWEQFPHFINWGIGGKKISSLTGILLDPANINHINVTWNGTVYPHLSISIDIVAGLPYSEWFPPMCRETCHPLLHKNGCFVVAKRSDHAPKDQRDFLGRFSFSVSECDLILEMPVALRKGYMLAKHMRHPSICPVICDERRKGIPVSKVVSSYLLKNCIMEEYTKLKDDEVDETLERIIHYEHCIYVRLEVALRRGCLPMFFIPGQNLLGNHSDEEIQLAIEYCKLIRQLLKDPDCLRGLQGCLIRPSTIEY